MPTVAGFGLGGDADGGREGWEDRVKTKIHEQTAAQKAKQRRYWDSSLVIWFQLPWRTLVRQAADRRGMSVSGYIRRATSAYIARDLGLSMEEVVEHTPHPAPRGSVMRETGDKHPLARGRLKDDGTGFGDWPLPPPPKESS